MQDAFLSGEERFRTVDFHGGMNERIGAYAVLLDEECTRSRRSLEQITCIFDLMWLDSPFLLNASKIAKKHGLDEDQCQREIAKNLTFIIGSARTIRESREGGVSEEQKRKIEMVIEETRRQIHG